MRRLLICNNRVGSHLPTESVLRNQLLVYPDHVRCDESRKYFIFYHITYLNITFIQLFNPIKDPLRPKEISNCPKIFKLLIERSLDGDPDRRPSMHFIYEVMKSLDSLLNKEPIKPLVAESDEDKDTKSINHETNDKTILNTNGYARKGQTLIK
jgi:hypothetical protein